MDPPNTSTSDFKIKTSDNDSDEQVTAHRVTRSKRITTEVGLEHSKRKRTRTDSKQANSNLNETAMEKEINTNVEQIQTRTSRSLESDEPIQNRLRSHRSTAALPKPTVIEQTTRTAEKNANTQQRSKMWRHGKFNIIMTSRSRRNSTVLLHR